MDIPSLVFIPIFKYLVSSVLHGNLLCRHLQIIFISTAVILPKLYDVYIVHNIELQCWYLTMHPKTHGKVVEIASVPFFCLWSLKYVLPSNLQTCAIHWTKVKYINYGRLMFCSIGQMGKIDCGLFSVKVVQINYVSRNQLHCTANLNFGLMCKKAKYCWDLSTNFLFLFSWSFFLIMVCFLLNWRKNSNHFKIAVFSWHRISGDLPLFLVALSANIFVILNLI